MTKNSTLSQDDFIAYAMKEFGKSRIQRWLERENTDIRLLTWEKLPKKLVASFPLSQRILLVLSQVAIQHGLRYAGYAHQPGTKQARFTVYISL